MLPRSSPSHQLFALAAFGRAADVIRSQIRHRPRTEAGPVEKEGDHAEVLAMVGRASDRLCDPVEGILAELQGLD